MEMVDDSGERFTGLGNGLNKYGIYASQIMEEHSGYDHRYIVKFGELKQLWIHHNVMT